MLFADLGLCEPILKSLTLANYTEATPIQSQAIPTILSGQDLLGVAQTGTGKTAAFALPCLDRILSLKAADGNRTVIRCLVLVPTRELALQVSTSFNKYGRGTGLRYTVAFGGVSQFKQVEALRSGVDALIATPGRLEDLYGQRRLDLSHVKILVLDEADQMLDMGFVVPIRRIAGYCPPKHERQNLMFSATMPREIKTLARDLMRDYAEVSVAPSGTAAELVDQSVFMVDRNSKGFLLRHYLKENSAWKALVFTRTKHGADRVARGLVKTGVSAAAIHGNRSQPQRTRALEAFKKGDIAVLVATDVAARGLHISEVSHVVNFDLPETPETYVHRIGRTGRAGASGIAVSFVGNDERSKLRMIERLLRKSLPTNPLPELPAPGSHDPEDDRHDDEDGDDRRSSGRDSRGSRGGGGGRSQGRDHSGSRDSRGGDRDNRGGGRGPDNFRNNDSRGPRDRFAPVGPGRAGGNDRGSFGDRSGPPAGGHAPARPAHFERAASPVHAERPAPSPRPIHADRPAPVARPAHIDRPVHIDRPAPADRPAAAHRHVAVDRHPAHPTARHPAGNKSHAPRTHMATHRAPEGDAATGDTAKAPIHRKGPGSKAGVKPIGKKPFAKPGAGVKPFGKGTAGKFAKPAGKFGKPAGKFGKPAGKFGAKPGGGKSHKKVAAHQRPQSAGPR